MACAIVHRQGSGPAAILPSNEGGSNGIEELRRCDSAGLARADKSLRNVRSVWIKEQHVRCSGGEITDYQVNMMVTFVLDDRGFRPGCRAPHRAFTMKTVKVREGGHERAGWGAASGGRHDSRAGGHEHTGVRLSVRSCTPALESRSPVEPGSPP